jgi:hypothetical protein
MSQRNFRNALRSLKQQTTQVSADVIKRIEDADFVQSSFTNEWTRYIEGTNNRIFIVFQHNFTSVSTVSDCKVVHKELIDAKNINADNVLASARNAYRAGKLS